MFAFTSRRVRGSIACALALAIGGCAGGDATSDLTTQSVAQTAAPVPAGKGRIVLSRPGGIQYMAVAANVKVNGNEVASLYGDNSKTVDVAPGILTIMVDAATYPGSWTEQLSVKAGSVYEIEVGPREGSGATAMLFGVIGGAVEAQNNPKSGLFEWKVTKQTGAQVAAAPAAPAKQTKAAPPAKAATKAAAAPKAE